MKNTDLQKMKNYLNRKKIGFKVIEMEQSMNIETSEFIIKYFKCGKVSSVKTKGLYSPDLASGHRQALNLMKRFTFSFLDSSRRITNK